MKLQHFTLSCLLAICMMAALGAAQASNQDAEATPKTSTVEFTVGAPIPALLRKGLAVVPFQTEHVKIAPIYGESAAQVVPQPAHLHVKVDDAAWHWVHATQEPIVIQNLPKGPHRLTVDLADANHRVLVSRDVSFVIP